MVLTIRFAYNGLEIKDVESTLAKVLLAFDQAVLLNQRSDLLNILCKYNDDGTAALTIGAATTGISSQSKAIAKKVGITCEGTLYDVIYEYPICSVIVTN